MNDFRKKLAAIYDRTQAHTIDRYAAHLEAGMASAFIDTPLRQAHFLAQVGHESGGLRWTEEFTTGAAYEGRASLGNRQPGDGRRFKGRGLIQLTGRANYEAFADDENEPDILAEPSRVATDPRLAALTATWFWRVKRLNPLADLDDLVAVTRRVNGGTNGLADRREILDRAKRVLGA